MPNWKKFEGFANRKNPEKARITFSPRRFFSLNPQAYKAVGSPSAVEFFYDEHERKIGIMRCDPHRKNAFKVQQEKGKTYHVVYAAAFCQHFNIRTPRTVLFEEIDMEQGGMLVLDLTKTTHVGRGSR